MNRVYRIYSKNKWLDLGKVPESFEFEKIDSTFHLSLTLLVRPQKFWIEVFRGCLLLTPLQTMVTRRHDAASGG